MNDLRPFRFWCQKVLPLVYDDSLSYYELLCKVVDYLNKTMEIVNKLRENCQALSGLFPAFSFGCPFGFQKGSLNRYGSSSPAGISGIISDGSGSSDIYLIFSGGKLFERHIH